MSLFRFDGELKKEDTSHGYYVYDDKKNRDDIPKIGVKEMIAIMIAQFQILFPIALGAVVIFGLVLLFITKVWWRV